MLLDFLPPSILGDYLQLNELWNDSKEGVGALINKWSHFFQELPFDHVIGIHCMFYKSFYDLEKLLEVGGGCSQPVDIIRAMADGARDLIDDLRGLKREGDDGKGRGCTSKQLHTGVATDADIDRSVSKEEGGRS